VALLALVIAVCVPLANTFAVYALARHAQRGLLRELALNPLILATLAGLITNLLGWQVPAPLSTALIDRLGSGGLALGLLCIGAGLTLGDLQAPRRVLLYFSSVKLLAFPALALAFAHLAQLGPIETQLVVLFAALPTASTAYVLAARMGGRSAPVAYSISAQTLASALTLPLWMAIAAALH